MIPVNIAEAMGGRKQFRVTGTLNGIPMKTSTFPYWGNGLWMGIHKAAREKAGLESGDEMEIEMMRDDSPRVLELAPELGGGLAAEPTLRERFDSLSFTRRRDLADPIAEAKKPETRAAHLEKAIDALREAQAREIEHLGSRERSSMVIGPRWADRHGVEGWVQEELVRQAQQGDAEAFDALARMVGDRCLAIAVRILRDSTWPRTPSRPH